MLEASKDSHSFEVETVKYAQSSRVVDAQDSSVSYAAVAITLTHVQGSVVENDDDDDDDDDDDA